MIKRIQTITLVTILIVIGIGVFYACKKEETVSLLTSSLTKELTSLNNEIYSQIETQQKGKFGDFIACAGADAIGTWEGMKIGGAVGGMFGPGGAATGSVIGGVVCGGGASYATGKGLGCWKSIEDPYPNGYVSTLSSSYADFNTFGALHNGYLDLLFKSKNNYIEPQYIYNQVFIDIESIGVTTFEQIYKELGPNSKHSIEILSLINNYISNDLDYNILISHCKEKFGMSKEAEEIWYSFFKIYFSTTRISDAYFVIENYIDFIQKSGSDYLKNDEINSFNCAFSVALHSTNYWSILN